MSANAQATEKSGYDFGDRILQRALALAHERGIPADVFLARLTLETLRAHVAMLGRAQTVVQLAAYAQYVDAGICDPLPARTDSDTKVAP